MKIKILFISIILSIIFINAKAAENSILDIKDNDFYIGEENAPITIIGYESMSCSHCADFHNNTLEDLTAESERYSPEGFKEISSYIKSKMKGKMSSRAIDKILSKSVRKGILLNSPFV